MYDGSLTFRDIMIHVAVALNIASYPNGANNSADLPTDPNRLSRLKRCVNSGARRFCNSTVHPLDKSRRTRMWSWIQPRIELNFASGDTSKPLPLGISSAPRGAVTWNNTDDNQGAGDVYVVAIDRVERMLAQSPSTTGTPLYCAARRTTRPTLGNRPQLELVVFPAPDRAVTIGAKFRMQPVEMIDLAEQGIWPPEHDDTVIKFAINSWKMEDADSSAANDEKEMLASSFDRDSQNFPKSLGKLSGSGSTFAPQSRTTLLNAVNGTTLIE